MRRRLSGRVAVSLAVGALLAAPGAGEPLRVEPLPLADGSVVPGHSSLAGELTDREAARRRSELLRSPFAHVGERRSVLAGEAVAGFHAAVPQEVREAALGALERAVRDVLDRDGWARPFSAASPLTVLLVPSRSELGVLVAWDGREKGRLARPLVAVGTVGRTPAEVAFDVARGVALLAVRQAGPDEAGWAVEGLAELLAQEALGLTAPPKAASNPFLASRGSLGRPGAAALFLRAAARNGTTGREGLRGAWEEAGQQRGDDAEAFFRTAAGTAGEGVAGLLSELVAEAVARAPTFRDDATAPVVPGDTPLAAPAPLGWARLTLTSREERSGLELALPDARAARGARAVVVYRPLAGEPDTLTLTPGGRQLLPLAGTETVSVILVDGQDGGDVAVRLRRVPGYPALLSSSSAEWADGAVHLGWRTSSHEDLLAWVVRRYLEDDAGSLVPDGDAVVPTTDASTGGSGFLLVDGETLPDRRYVYRVAALTRDGLLSEAFEASVGTGVR